MASAEPGKPEMSVARAPHDVAGTGELSFARGLWRMSGARTSAGNQLKLLVDGPRAFAEMIEAIGTARTEVALENYIIYPDQTGQEFADALAGAAARGVRVRVVADWIGSRTTRRWFWNGMRERGVHVRVYGTPRLGRWLGLLPRDHRKQLVVDAEVGFTGGFGIGDPWGRPLPAGSPERAWRDTGVRIEGPAARDMMFAFERMWRQARGEPASSEPNDPHAMAVDSTEGGLVGIIEGVPGRLRVERGFHFQAAAAMQSIWIANAYFIPTPSELEALVLAAADGVDVRLLVPSRSDHPWVRRLTRRNYRRLRNAAVRIWEWQGAMMHAKTSVVDRRWVRIGSTDINPLGVAINYELDAVICDAAFGEAAAVQYLEDVDRSHEIR